MPLKPKISILIVVRNGEKDLEFAIRSVVQQTYDNIEFIILDGKSTDGTLDIIKKYEAQLSLWVSEPDNGIFDAMNKALKLATGDWAYFLGCDDLLATPAIIEEMVINFDRREAIYYGNTYLKISNSLYTGKVNSWNLPLRNISHQAIFYPKSVYKSKEYNLKYKLTADHIYNLELYGMNANLFSYVPKLISIYNDQGVSSLNIDNQYKMDIVPIVTKNLGPVIGAYFWLRVKVANIKNSLKLG